MNGFIGLNDVIKHINLIYERRQAVKKWYAELAVKLMPVEEPAPDNN